LAAGLVERGHDVTVLTGLPNYPGGELFVGYTWFSTLKEEYKGVEIRRVPIITRGKSSGWRLLVNYISYAASATLLGWLHCRCKYDAILVFQLSPVTIGVPGIFLRWIKKIPLLFWVQDLWPDSLIATRSIRSRPIIYMVRSLVRFLYKHSDKVLVQSEAFRDKVIRDGASADDVLYFPNFAETLYNPVTPLDDAPERKEVPDGFCVMFAGNIGEAQAFDTIVAAANKLRDEKEIKWVILGDGRRKDWLEAKIVELELQDRFFLLGRRAVNTMPIYFSLADVMLVSLRKEPIFALTIPSKVQSYLACAKPIVASLDGEGARVIEQAGAGLTAPAGDVDGLAEAVRLIYQKTEEKRKKMGLCGLDYFNLNFERELQISRLEAWLDEIGK
ncbi:MAG: glycosyltransferase family 4 protein, partial [Oceanicoccus sp.]|uniref:glycosyltransferase family 4 protein n=1 Tax=Oceanicoccus sp. TaxID=2691044 RepID=UPI00260FF2E8